MTSSVNVSWIKDPKDDFLRGKYSRIHQWDFDGGAQLKVSSSPSIVPIPMSNKFMVDPEEAFVASIASCHMLFFLSIAAKHQFNVLNYQCYAEGILKENEEGALCISLINFYPKVVFEGERIPNMAKVRELHQTAHSQCFLANSVQSNININ